MTKRRRRDRHYFGKRVVTLHGMRAIPVKSSPWSKKKIIASIVHKIECDDVGEALELACTWKRLNATSEGYPWPCYITDTDADEPHDVIAEPTLHALIDIMENPPVNEVAKEPLTWRPLGRRRVASRKVPYTRKLTNVDPSASLA